MSRCFWLLAAFSAACTSYSSDTEGVLSQDGSAGVASYPEAAVAVDALGSVAAADAITESGTDGAGDAGHDALADGSPDAKDAATDGSPDASKDATSDADASWKDATSDSATDAPTDAKKDATDGSSDAPKDATSGDADAGVCQRDVLSDNWCRFATPFSFAYHCVRPVDVNQCEFLPAAGDPTMFCCKQ